MFILLQLNFDIYVFLFVFIKFISVADSIGNSSFAVDTQMSSWTLLRTGLTYIPSFYMCLNAYISSQRFYVISIRFFHKFPNFDNNGKEL